MERFVRDSLRFTNFDVLGRLPDYAVALKAAMNSLTLVAVGGDLYYSGTFNSRVAHTLISVAVGTICVANWLVEREVVRPSVDGRDLLPWPKLKR